MPRTTQSKSDYCLSTKEAALLGRLFTPSVLGEMAEHGKSPLFARLVSQFDSGAMAFVGTVGDYLDYAYDLLGRYGGRSEYIYKAALWHQVLSSNHALSSNVLMSEFRTGASKADMVVLNGTGTVYEIKSERDNLDRLLGQITDYRLVFPKINVIAPEGHIPGIEKIVSDSVGLLTMGQDQRLIPVREAKRDYSSLSVEQILRSVRLVEAKKMVCLLGGQVPVAPNTRMYKELLAVLNDYAAEDVHRVFVGVLKETRQVASIHDVVCQFPRSIQPRFYLSSTNFNRDHVNRITGCLNTSVNNAFEWV